MAAKRPQRRPASAGKPKAARKHAPKRSDDLPQATTVRARKAKGHDAWELVHPRCARERELDLEEVRKMIDAGETEVAVDECRWLLSGCSDCIAAHRLLGEVAMEAGDLPLARGHFGYAFRLGTLALDRAKATGPLPYRIPANQAFLESAKALALCLDRLAKRPMAEEVIARILQCDASDPLGVKKLLAPGDQPGEQPSALRLPSA